MPRVVCPTAQQLSKRIGRRVAFGRVRGANYAAAKAAMLGMAKTMALEGEQYGIKANCILPIAPFGRREAPPAIFTDHLARTGLKPEETGPALVAPIVTWMASRN